jgi:hypothetical protein
MTMVEMVSVVRVVAAVAVVATALAAAAGCGPSNAEIRTAKLAVYRAPIDQVLDALRGDLQAVDRRLAQGVATASASAAR